MNFDNTVTVQYNWNTQVKTLRLGRRVKQALKEQAASQSLSGDYVMLGMTKAGSLKISPCPRSSPDCYKVGSRDRIFVGTCRKEWRQFSDYTTVFEKVTPRATGIYCSY